ncbi:MAG: nucleoside hydrolase [Pseudomonadota bacterium]
MPSSRKILIDTDPGIDDAMAIHFAFAHPSLEVVGLTTVFGNVHVPVATRNALALVEMANAECPVAEGAAAPLVQALQPPAYFVHGEDGFGNSGVIEPSVRADPRPAAQFIVDQINQSPGEIYLCPVGPLTNIALALRLDPSISEKVAGVTIMGGAVTCPGNVTAWAEANIWNDPHAAAEVFAADWPIILVGLDVTETVRCDAAHFADLAEAAPMIGGFLNRAVQFYFQWHVSKPHYLTGPFEGCFMHDPSAIAAVLQPDLFTMRKMPVHVTTEGEKIGRTLADPDAAGRPIEVCVAVDADAVRQLFLETVKKADEQSAARSVR